MPKKSNKLKQMEVRAVTSSNFSFDDNNLKVSGYVNYTGTKSEPIPNFGDVPESDGAMDDPEYFIEIMQPGVFKDALENADFVDFLFEHEPKKYLASTHDNNLSLNEDDKGLHMSAQITPTSWGKDAYTLIKSGAVAGMSFGFRVLNDTWDLSGDVPVRTVNQIQLFEVSAVRFPAYDGSDISARKKHMRTVNKQLEKRGFTLHHVRVSKKTKRSVKPKMSKPFEENRASATNDNASQAPSSVDFNNIATSLDRLNTTMQSVAEVEDNIYKTFVGALQDSDRSKTPAHADEKRDKKSVDDNAKSETKAKAKTAEKSKSKPSTDKPKDDKDEAKKSADKTPKGKSKPTVKDEQKEIISNKRSKRADKMLAELDKITKK